jgi:hypothetical protein
MFAVAVEYPLISGMFDVKNDPKDWKAWTPFAVGFAASFGIQVLHLPVLIARVIPLACLAVTIFAFEMVEPRQVAMKDMLPAKLSRWWASRHAHKRKRAASAPAHAPAYAAVDAAAHAPASTGASALPPPASAPAYAPADAPSPAKIDKRALILATAEKHAYALSSSELSALLATEHGADVTAGYVRQVLSKNGNGHQS